jgi:peptide deformylase
MLEIIKYEGLKDTPLRLANINVNLEMPDLRALIDDMLETMKHANGVGLAAPQIGKNINLFVIKFGDWEEAFINPDIILTGNSIDSLEGCLSLPNKEFMVPRREKVIIRYYNKNLKWNVRTFEYPKCVVIQHEYDHLQGKLLCDYSAKNI